MQVLQRLSLGGVGLVQFQMLYPFVPKIPAGKAGSMLIYAVQHDDLVVDVIVPSVRLLQIVAYPTTLGAHFCTGPSGGWVA